MSTLSWGLQTTPGGGTGGTPDAGSTGSLSSGAASPSRLGVDVSALPTIGRRFRLIGGSENVAEALARRLITPRGSLHYSPDYGTDLRIFLNESFSGSMSYQVRSAIEAELRKDPRVETVSVSTVFDASTETLTATISVVTGEGPFELVVGISSLTVEMLES